MLEVAAVVMTTRALQQQEVLVEAAMEAIELHWRDKTEPPTRAAAAAVEVDLEALESEQEALVSLLFQSQHLIIQAQPQEAQRSQLVAQIQF